MRYIDQIVIHCSATEEGKPVTVAQIRQWHLKRGFKDIGYHYVIDIDGVIQPGRPLDQDGAHAMSYNVGSIGICYVGGLSLKTLKPMDTRTQRQRDALKLLINVLTVVFPITAIDGHRDLSVDMNGDGVISKFEWMKDCPCFNVHDEFKV